MESGMLEWRLFILRNHRHFNVRQCNMNGYHYSKCYEALQYALVEFCGKQLFIIATLTH